MWQLQPQAEALFDIHGIDTYAQSYQSHSPQTLLISAEAEKKCKYSTACSDHRASSTPLCFSVDGLLDCEADVFLKQMVNHLFDTWDQSFTDALLWIHLRLAISLLRP